MIIDSDVYLEHYGVKGMKWGVRKEQRAHKMKRTATQKKENKARRKAGLGTKAGKKVGVGERLRSGYDAYGPNPLFVAEAIVKRSVNTAQLDKAKRIEGRIARRKQGKASVGDKLAYYANFRVQDMTPTKRGSKDTKVDIGASLVGTVMSSVAIPVNVAGSPVIISGASVSLVGVGVGKVNQKVKARRSKKGG